MAFNEIKQAYHQAAEKYKTEHSAPKALKTFVSLCWLGKQTSVTASTTEQVKRGITTSEDFEVTSLSDRTAETEEVNPVKGILRKPPEPLTSQYEEGLEASTSTPKDDRHVHFNENTKTSDDHKVTGGGTKGKYGLSETVRKNLLETLDEEGTEGLAALLRNEIGCYKKGCKRLSKIFQFLKESDKMSSSVEQKWEEVFVEGLAHEVANGVTGSLVNDFNRNKEYAKSTEADFANEMAYQAQSKRNIKGNIKMVLSTLNLKLTKERKQKIVESATKQAAKQLKQDSQNPSDFWRESDRNEDDVTKINGHKIRF